MLILLTTVTGCKNQYTDVVVHKVDCCDVGNVVNGKLSLGFRLDVENPNNFNITIKEFDVDVKVNGVDIGKAETEERLTLLKSSRHEYRLQVSADVKKIIQGSLANLGALFGGKQQLNVEIDGDIKASAMGISRSIPVSGKYPLQLN